MDIRLKLSRTEKSAHGHTIVQTVLPFPFLPFSHVVPSSLFPFFSLFFTVCILFFFLTMFVLLLTFFTHFHLYYFFHSFLVS